MNPKQFAQTSHRIAVLSALLVESLEDINASSTAALDLKQKAQEIIPHCERMLEEVYTAKNITSGTYFNELSNKVDTVIRKNFEIITI
jgi:hypothetical protein